MLRELLTLVLPLVLPTVLYLVWLLNDAMGTSRRYGAVACAALGVARGDGRGLLALVLFVVTVHFGTTFAASMCRRSSGMAGSCPGHIEPCRNRDQA